MKISFKLFEKSRRDEIIVARHISAGSEARAQIEFRQERHHRMPFLTELRRGFCSLAPSTDVLGYCYIVPDGTFQTVSPKQARGSIDFKLSANASAPCWTKCQPDSAAQK